MTSFKIRREFLFCSYRNLAPTLSPLCATGANLEHAAGVWAEVSYPPHSVLDCPRNPERYDDERFDTQVAISSTCSCHMS